MSVSSGKLIDKYRVSTNTNCEHICEAQAVVEGFAALSFGFTDSTQADSNR